MNSEARQILEAVKAGSMSIDDALLEIKKEPFEDIGYAKVDLHRKIRQGAAEVIYGAGKTPEQMIGIVSAMLKNGQDHILITRLSSEAADMISQVHPLHYHKDARVGIIGEMPKPTGKGKIVEAIAANHMGMKICGISCIANPAAGISKKPLTHEEVQQSADLAAPKFQKLVTECICRMGKSLKK